MNTKIYRLPKRFADDHWGRDCGETDRIVRETTKHYYVEMDGNGWSDMESDADYYMGMGGEMIESMGIGFIASARATHAALVKAGAPGADCDCGCHVPEFAPFDCAAYGTPCPDRAK